MTRWGRSHARRGGARVELLEPRALLAASLVADVQQGSADAAPSVLVAGPERLYFRAFDGSTIGNEPYTYTPAAGAALLKDVNPEGDSVFYSLGGPGPPPPTPPSPRAAASTSSPSSTLTARSCITPTAPPRARASSRTSTPAPTAPTPTSSPSPTARCTSWPRCTTRR